MAVTLAAHVSYSASQALSDLHQILPIIAVSITLLLAIVVDLLLPRRARGQGVAVVGVAGLLAAVAAGVYLWSSGGHSAYRGFATGDRFAAFFEILFAALGVLTIAVAHSYLRRRRFLQAEFHVLVLSSVAGMMVLASATSLVSIFLGLELLSVSLYIASAFARADARSQEAGAKYLLVGGFASAFVLYGMALVYGASGSTVLAQIAHATASQGTNSALLFLGIVLMGVGFAFKVSAAPFHMWTPDVYQGAPLPVTAFMSVGTKAAAFAMIVRVFLTGLPSQAPEWQALLAFVAVASMVIGNVMAIAQTSVKRLLAYSGVAHAGYILIGVLAGGRSGLGAVLFYLVAYLFMNFGAFTVLFVLTRPEAEHDRLEDLDGIGLRRPWLGIAMTIFMLSLAGFPPSVGFFGKFFLFAAGVRAGYGWLVVLAVLMSVVSVYYYLRVLLHVWSPESAPRRWLPVPAGVSATVAVAGLGSLVLGIYPALLLTLGQRGGGPLGGSP